MDRAFSESQIIRAEWALLPDGWHQSVQLKIDSRGKIEQIESAAQEGNHSDAPHVQLDIVVPGMINTHSHAFQRAMVGKTQRFSKPGDDFWSWRKEMYKEANELTPSSQENISSGLFDEMIANGYTTVCEFQYAHGAINKDNAEIPALMSEALIQSARNANIRMLLLPVLYQQAGFANRPPELQQRPFILNTPVYLGLMEHLQELISEYDTISLGYAPHSLRAVGYDALTDILDHRQSADPESPVHIHISEQIREVNECSLSTGKTPIEWLLDTAEVDERWCLIHATHGTADELSEVRNRRAVVGLCPTTEADLGDGHFPFASHLENSGLFSIGSDSNVCVSPCEEVRLIDYQCRLSRRKRNALRFDTRMGAGTQLYLRALEGGRAASGKPVGRIEAGSFADLVSLNSDHVLARDRSPDEIMNAYIYSGGSSMIDAVLVGGKSSLTQ